MTALPALAPVRRRPPRRRAIPVSALLALLLGASACAGPGLLGRGPAPDRRAGPVERPAALPEYDVLVGSLALAEGRPEDAREAFGRAAAKDPDSPWLHRMLGRLAAQQEDLGAAFEHARRAVELDPDDEESRLFLGRLYRMRRDAAGAEEVLLDDDGRPVSPKAGLLLYQIHLEGNRLAQALTVASDLVDRNPDHLGARMALATALERLGRTEEAEASLREALESHPGRFVLYSRLARMRRAAGDRQGEIAVYREALEVNPGHYGTLVSLAEAQIAVEDLEGALRTYEEILERFPDDLQSVRRLASLEFALGRPEEAAARLEAALARHPDHEQLAYALGQVWKGAGELERALEVFRAIGPDDDVWGDAQLQIAEILEDQERYGQALERVEAVRRVRDDRELDFHAAVLRWRAGDFEGGVSLLEDMLERSPGDDEILYQLGVLHGMAKRVDEALAYMRRALEANPENAHALNYIGYTWAERGENLEEAEDLILRALALRPDDGYITDSLGWVYYMRARPLLGAGREEAGRELLEQAREKLFRAQELTGGDPVVSEHLGDVFLLLDQKERALHHYEEALRQDPRNDEQPDLMDKVRQLREELRGQ